jgi:hypothetical protein
LPRLPDDNLIHQPRDGCVIRDRNAPRKAIVICGDEKTVGTNRQGDIGVGFAAPIDITTDLSDVSSENSDLPNRRGSSASWLYPVSRDYWRWFFTLAACLDTKLSGNHAFVQPQ